MSDDFVGGYALDRSSPVPAYYQLQEWLTGRIESGHLPAGTKLPSERELTESLGVSRMTLRQATDRLVREGRLERRQGTGTFVASPHLVADMNAMRSVTDELASQGRSSRTHVLGVERVAPPARVRDALELSARRHAILVERVRSVDGMPLSLERSWLHPVRCKAILTEDLTDRSLNELLTERCGLVLARAQEKISATVLDTFEAEELEAPEGTPAFRVQRTTWTEDLEPVEFVVSVLRGDRFNFEASLADGRSAERLPTLHTGADQ